MTPAARTLRLTLAYDGTNYVGWQRQPTGASVQQVVEDAFRPLVGEDAEPPAVAGAGRTDAGVHARGQVASIRVDFDHDTDAVRRALNVRLPPDVRVLDVVEAAPGFHARFDARGKRYLYRLATAPVLSPFDRWFVWHLPQRCDRAAMRRAARCLVGRHDFASFQASGSSIAGTERTIMRLDVTEAGDECHVEVEGDGFLRHMVRIIVGSLVEVGVGTRPPDWMAEVLAAHDRRAAGRTAPASGLTLMAIRY
jgi:tRNA pseudouridine38-40 synthase